MNRLWIVILVILVSCAGQHQNEILVQNVGFTQGSTFNVQYMSPNATDYQWQVDSILAEMDSSLSTYQRLFFNFKIESRRYYYLSR